MTVDILRRALNTERRRNARHALATEVIVTAVDEALTRDPPRYKAQAFKPRKRGGVKLPEEIAVLQISDTQIGKVTADYNSDIAEERISKLVERVIRITDVRRAGATINEIHVALDGDMVEGEAIFAHQAHTIDQSVFDQAINRGPRIFVDVILTLLKHFERVKVFGICGNHGRNGPRNGGANPRTNWDRVLYSTTRHILKGCAAAPRQDANLNRLEFVVPDTFYYVDRIFGWGALHVHGHQINGGGAGFPISGTTKKAFGWIDSIPTPWDYMYFGHFHTYTSGTLNHRVWFCNGTTESANTFAQEQLAATGDPVQRLQFYDETHGMIADYPIYLGGQRFPRT